MSEDKECRSVFCFIVGVFPVASLLCVSKKIQQVVRSVQASLPSHIASATFAQAELISTLNPLSVDFSCVSRGLNFNKFLIQKIWVAVAGIN